MNWALVMALSGYYLFARGAVARRRNRRRGRPGAGLRSRHAALGSVVGVGLLYGAGYFKQALNRDGWQVETYPVLDPDGLPLTLVREPDGRPSRVSAAVNSRPARRVAPTAST